MRIPCTIPIDPKMTHGGAREHLFTIFGFSVIGLFRPRMTYRLKYQEFNYLSFKAIKQFSTHLALGLKCDLLSQPIRSQYFILPFKSVLMAEIIVLMHIWH